MHYRCMSEAPPSGTKKRQTTPFGIVCLDVFGRASYFFSHWSNQSMKLRCQRRLFWGLSTQWVSSGK